VSCLQGKRWTTIADVESFCSLLEQGKSAVTDKENLTAEARFRETVVMGLRMTRGISLRELEDRFGINARQYYGSLLDRLVAQGLLERTRDRLQLTGQGMLLANTVMAELV